MIPVHHDYEGPVYRRISSRLHVKAKQQHSCSVCGGTIEPGETYNRHTYVSEDDGDLYTDKAHDTYCEEVGAR